MKRPWQIWLIFGICGLAVLAALGRLTFKALELDRAEALARRQAALEENSRLALWRMDSAMAPLVARESARPYFAYQPFYSVAEAAGRTSNGRSMAGKLAPSPLLTRAVPQVRLHFQIDAAGRLSAPRLPTEPLQKRAVPQYLSQEEIHEAEARLARVRQFARREVLLAGLPEGPESTFETAQMPPPQQIEGQGLQTAERPLPQQTRNASEFQARSQFLVQNNSINFEAQQLGPSNTVGPPTDEQAGMMVPLWIEGELLLARKVAVRGQDVIQACWLDWPAIKSQLLASIGDLLPAADLQAVIESPLDEQSRMLAALPVQLEPGTPYEPTAAGLSPIHISLIVAWGSLCLAVLAVAALLQGVLALSERRATFVSAVTHELRTPLTTFRMYAEMLAEGMVPDEETRRRYLGTLCVEADRLTHLVENVLTYARLERGRVGDRCVPIRVTELLEVTTARVRERALQAGWQLAIDVDAAVGPRSVLADAAAVEQILFNLVDNACKYAAAATDRTLHLNVEAVADQIRLRLRDHGPGIAAPVRKRLFQPFHKSAPDAAHTVPGVGLGLALSRRLARALGGDLRLDDQVVNGAGFVLTLPVVKSRSI
jgi:signal transduction histidine kinase